MVKEMHLLSRQPVGDDPSSAGTNKLLMVQDRKEEKKEHTRHDWSVLAGRLVEEHVPAVLPAVREGTRPRLLEAGRGNLRGPWQE